MTSPHRRAVLPGCLAALLLAVLLALGAAPAGAADGRVTLDSDGPTPETVTITRGSRVVFTNADNGDHTITSNAGDWSFTATIRPGASATTPPFPKGGRFGYRDSFSIAVVQREVNGFVQVRVPASTASPKPSTSAGPGGSPRPRPSTTPPATPGGSPSPSATGSGLAAPPLGAVGIPPVLPPPVVGGPAPNVAPPELPGVTATPSATTLSYGPQSAIVQDSPHRYGLPVLLALLAAVGTLSLLVRTLLAEPLPVRRTAGAGATAPDSTDDAGA